MEDELCDLVRLRGEDADTALEVQTEDKVVYNNSAEIRADHAEDDGLLVVAESGGKSDNHPGDGHRLSEIHAQVAVHQLRHDVQTARGGITGEKKCQTDADRKDVADRIDERIGGERLKIRERDFVHAHNGGKQDGGIHGFDAEFRADQKESDQQKDHVQQECDGGDGQGDKIADDKGKRGGTADGHVARQHEKVDRGGDDGGADGDDKEFADRAFVEHGIFLTFG